MAKNNTRYAAVAGFGDFPLDMCRYDYCYPVLQKDVVKAGERGHRAVVVRTDLNGRFEPARWLSFMWTVIAESKEESVARDAAEDYNRKQEIAEQVQS